MAILSEFEDIDQLDELEEERNAPDIQSWQDTFSDLDELIYYHNDRAKEFFDFYTLEKTKLVTYGELLDYQPEDMRQTLEPLVDKSQTIESTFSLYCYQYDKNNIATSCKCRINFVLKVKETKFNGNGNLEFLKYQRSSYCNAHSHNLYKKDFEPRYNLLKFLEDDLSNFGSNNNQPKS